METRVLTVIDAQHRAEAVREAGRALAEGQLVIFPTETVYGVGASAVHPGAVEALSVLKGRTPDKPFALHLADPAEAERYAGPLPPLARRLIQKTWPGPLTLVVPDRRPDRTRPAGLVEDAIYYEGTVGLRCPRSDVGQAILRAAGVPVVGSSANLVGPACPAAGLGGPGRPGRARCPWRSTPARPSSPGPPRLSASPPTTATKSCAKARSPPGGWNA